MFHLHICYVFLENALFIYFFAELLLNSCFQMETYTIDILY